MRRLSPFRPLPAARAVLLPLVLVAGLAACDPRPVPPGTRCGGNERACLLPFPNDRFTVRDGSTATGRRVAFPEGAMPANVAGVRIDPTEWNQNDGFSPGSPVMTFAPGIDLSETHAAPITDIGSSLRDGSPTVLLDVQTGERWPHFVELDVNATNPEDQLLYLRPARNFTEGHRYVVLLRKLRDAEGVRLPADERALAVRNGERSAPRLERIFDDLRDADIRLRALHSAWDFTVASGRNLSERLLHMRDDAFATLGDAPPAFTVEEVEDFADGPALRTVAGTIEVPQYLTCDGGPGSGRTAGSDGLPVQNGTYDANFLCVVPRSATGAQARPVVYGHGLFGGSGEVNGFAEFGDQAGILFCATDWIGMAGPDIPNAAAILTDLSSFHTLADRLQQGILNMQFLARALKDERAFASAPAFRVGGRSAILPGEVWFNGNIQGGSLGGAATAISKEWTRAVLGVPAMNYSTLLRRSVDFDPFGALLGANYPDPVEQELGIALVQMLWDRGENNGYAAHMTDDPYPGTPEHQVLLIEAFGDHQVANIATETMARTIGATVHRPVLRPGRSPDVRAAWGLADLRSDPDDGSVLVVWDFGTPAPPTVNIAPRPPEYGEDPHGKGRGEPRLLAQADAFLQPGGTFSPAACAGPCVSPG
ncbi:hypothetical protein BH18ACT1_BH18ACT1_11430 [soil metagenome]